MKRARSETARADVQSRVFSIERSRAVIDWLVKHIKAKLCLTPWMYRIFPGHP
jgi:hypothetical protein